MGLGHTIRTWERLGSTEPLWAILNDKHKKDGAWDTDEFFRTGDEEITSVVAYLDSHGIRPRPDRALDFGCGAGRLTQALARFFKRVTGVDAAPSMVALAQKLNREKPQCRFLLAQTGALSLFPDQSFDFIYSSITLQHMEPRYARRYLKEFFRVLASGGVMAFQLPSERIGKTREQNPFGKMFKRLIPAPLIRQYHRARYGKDAFIEMYGAPRRDVTMLLENLGARVIGVEENRDAGDDWISFRYYALKP